MGTMTSSSSIQYPPGPHSILPEKLLREFMHDPIKTLMNIAHMYVILLILSLEDSMSIYLMSQTI
jgi:hypothetical protein